MRNPRWLPEGTSDLNGILTNIAQIYNSAYVFDNCYVAATNCSPSRAALMTGLYSQQTCMFATQDPPPIVTSGHQPPYPPSLQTYASGMGFATIGDVLTQSTALAGAYYCVHFGKWHLSDNPMESEPGQGSFTCNPGGNGPSDYGFVDPTSGQCPACIPTPPANQPTGSPYQAAPYPSPTGLINTGNSGDFEGNASVPAVGDVPNYGTCPGSSPYPCPPFPLSSMNVMPPSYNGLNDAAVADAFMNWFTGVNGVRPPADPTRWFAVVSFLNPHDITQFPWAFGLVDQSSGCAYPTYFCEPSSGLSANPNGFETPPVVTSDTTIFSVNSQETESTVIPAPYENLSFYSSANLPMWNGVSWNFPDDPSTQPYTTTGSGSGKPNLQTYYQNSANSLYGVIEDNAGTDATGWYMFLNYYIWMQQCVDRQVKVVLDAIAPKIGTSDYPVIIFTADHGEFGGSHSLHAKGGALYDEAMNVPLYVSMPNQTRSLPRSFVCSNVDILPMIYSLAIGNESWRCDSTDIINYLNGRESILDAMYSGTAGAQQRRQSSFPLLNPDCLHPVQPYVLHTNDEYFMLNPQTQSAPNTPPHAVAFRTVDNTITNGGISDSPPYGGGKYGVYSYWTPGTITPYTNPGSGQMPQYEFYNYQPSTPPNTLGNGGTNLNQNLGEMMNDWWNCNNQTPQPAIGAQYKNVFATFPTQELTTIYPQIVPGYVSAFNLWMKFSFQKMEGGVPVPHGLGCSDPYFTLSPSVPLITIARGSQGSVTITATFQNGFSTGIGFSVAGLPSQVTENTGSLPPITANNGTSTLTMTVGSMATRGTYQITVSGMGDVFTSSPLTQIVMIVLKII